MERDYLADSQDDLFKNSQVGPLSNISDSPQLARVVPESPPAPPTVDIPPQDKIMAVLSEILKEQKKLTEEVNTLRGEIQRIKNKEALSMTKVSVEGATIEKEYVNFLKAKFSVFPWINFQDQEIQGMLKDFTSKAGWAERSHFLGVLSSFGSTKFTYYRNQTRAKLMGNKEIDVEGLSLKSLHNYLWKCFLPPAIPLVDTERERLTLLLRSFCASQKLFHEGGTSDFAFWAEFHKLSLWTPSIRMVDWTSGRNWRKRRREELRNIYHNF